ncbi:Transcriptional regulator, MarR family [hydrothermal vent metagenome]|uniref:Transcriptional regulator, MarR family n=1 Tax=hydrothermal vent metagenome TaxID=652676 RepID=A0A3B1AU17_9ZZZZ
MTNNKDKALVLENFLPYQLSFLTNIISHQLAQLYTTQFDITPHEWKILAILNRYPNISAAQAGEKTAMDKVAVSRAIKGLSEKKLVHKIFSAEDKRRSVLNLTDQGTDLFHKIAPLVTEYENSLLAILTKQQQAQLDQLLDKLTHHVSGGKP